MSQLAVAPARSVPAALAALAVRVQVLAIRAVEAWRSQRAATELYDLDPAMLRDIGVGRSEIEHIVRHGRASRARLRLAESSLGAAKTVPLMPLSWTEWR